MILVQKNSWHCQELEEQGWGIQCGLSGGDTPCTTTLAHTSLCPARQLSQLCNLPTPCLGTQQLQIPPLQPVLLFPSTSSLMQATLLLESPWTTGRSLQTAAQCLEGKLELLPRTHPGELPLGPTAQTHTEDLQSYPIFWELDPS